MSDGGARRKRLVTLVLVALGVVAVAAVVLGAFVSSSESTSARQRSDASLTPSRSGPITTPRATSPEQAAARTFVEQLDVALRGGDTQFLISHLHPAVIARYGLDQCRTHQSALGRGTARYVVQTVDAPAPYVYASDGKTTTIPEVVAVHVARVEGSNTTKLVVPTVKTAGLYRYFTDCGTPSG